LTACCSIEKRLIGPPDHFGTWAFLKNLRIGCPLSRPNRNSFAPPRIAGFDPKPTWLGQHLEPQIDGRRPGSHDGRAIASAYVGNMMLNPRLTHS
jgi:hypothetical protein